MQTLILITDVDGIGKQFEIVSVEFSKALDLLSQRKAFADTPLIRKRFAGLIRLPVEQ